MDFADFMDHSGIEQNPFRCGRLARINVGSNSDVSYSVERNGTSHGDLLDRG
jgi:hypothetical protein